LLSLRRHHHRKRHLDEFFILVHRLEGTTDVFGDVGRAALLNPESQLHDGGFHGELIFVELVKL
jgi:hypothetical protein